MKIFVALVLVGTFATHAHASKPIPWTMKGCVAGGVFYSVDAGGAVRVKSSLDVSKLDGKFIEVEGWLHPGDEFSAASDKRPIVKRDCNADDRLAIEYAKAQELRLDAARLPADKLDDAIKLIEASIALVQPAACDSYIDRAHLYARKNDLAAAARDVGILETRKCLFSGLLNWLLLQELGNELLARKDAKTAVRALMLARVSCDAEICRPDIERDLAAATAAASKK